MYVFNPFTWYIQFAPYIYIIYYTPQFPPSLYNILYVLYAPLRTRTILLSCRIWAIESFFFVLFLLVWYTRVWPRFGFAFGTTRIFNKKYRTVYIPAVVYAILKGLQRPETKVTLRNLTLALVSGARTSWCGGGQNLYKLNLSCVFIIALLTENVLYHIT